MNRVSRRTALKAAAATFAAPFVWRHHAHAAPSETVLHASFGADGMAGSDLRSLTASKNLKLVAVAEVDQKQKNLANLKKQFPDLRVYDDFRVLLDKEKDLHSVNVSTPDHMHAPIAMTAMKRGLHVYGQKPLTQTIFEAPRLTEVAAEKKLPSSDYRDVIHERLTQPLGLPNAGAHDYELIQGKYLFQSKAGANFKVLATSRDRSTRPCRSP